ASLEQDLDVLGRMDGAQLVGGGNAGADALPQAGRGAFEPASTRPEWHGALVVHDVVVLKLPVVTWWDRLLLGVEPESVEERVIEDEQFHAKSVPSSSVVRHGSRVLRSLVASCGRGPGRRGKPHAVENHLRERWRRHGRGGAGLFPTGSLPLQRGRQPRRAEQIDRASSSRSEFAARLGRLAHGALARSRSEEHTSELQSRENL